MQGRPNPTSRTLNAGRAEETQGPEQSYAEKDALSYRSKQMTREDISRIEREKYRKEEDAKEDLRMERERIEARLKVVEKVSKGVPKLKEIKKARDVFLGRHVSIGQLSRLFGVRLGGFLKNGSGT